MGILVKEKKNALIIGSILNLNTQRKNYKYNFYNLYHNHLTK
jgi:hypothetical protein